MNNVSCGFWHHNPLTNKLWLQMCICHMASKFPDQNMVSYMHKVAKINAPNFVILWFRNLTFSWNEKAAVSIYFRHFVHIADHIYNSIADLAREFHSLCIQRCCLETKIAPVKTYQLKALVKTCNFVTSFWYLKKKVYLQMGTAFINFSLTKTVHKRAAS